MTVEFEPQMTTMGSFTETEAGLYHRFMEMDFGEELSKAVAHSFTRYMLGYVTEEGVAQTLLSHGADRDTARRLAEMFHAVKAKARSEQKRTTGGDKEMAFP